MSSDIRVDKKSVKMLLEEGKAKSFVIPEYQRPYAWESDQVDTLFNDLWEFASEYKGDKDTKTYFLGSVVSYTNGNTQEIIDGQQRLTTLFLLLRAIYAKLEADSVASGEKDNFMKQIEGAIWKTNYLTGAVDRTALLLRSEVIGNDGNELLRTILESGEADSSAKDNYSRNYRRLQELLDAKSLTSPMTMYEFIYTLLNKAILLPITADDQDTALTIFSTLNDRGLPLADADIFKAKIYKGLDDEEKRDFISSWKALDERCESADESIQKLFYYYMFYLRAQEGDKKSTTPGARKYFAKNSFAKLKEKGLLQKLDSILNIWVVVNCKQVIDEEQWSQNVDIRKALDVLNSYPNEFWKYPVIIFYLAHKDNPGFEEAFLLFLRKLIVELLEKYLETPTINAVKGDILKLNTEIISTMKPCFSFDISEPRATPNRVKQPNRNAVRMLLKILAYEKQDELLPDKWEIEHIFPQTWQPNYFGPVSDEVVNEKIEHLGNKVPFEKKLNIRASNGFFAKKQGEYAQSKISITKELSDTSIHDWDLDSISERDVRISDAIIKIFEGWRSAYLNYSSEAIAQDESNVDIQAALELLKKRGYDVSAPVNP